MKYLLILTAFITGCTAFTSPKYKQGQKVTNGYCTGYVNAIDSLIYDFKYRLILVKCVGYDQNFMYINESEITGEGI